jgi:tetratricopeptide (TPR) repeat protein
MNWLRTESLLKGIYLGLLFFVALRVPDWPALLTVNAAALGGLALALFIAGAARLREGYEIKGRLLPFILFLLLESPTLVYAGILFGATAGAFLALPVGATERTLLIELVGGGALLGILFGVLQSVADRRVRLGLSLLVAAALVAAVMLSFTQLGFVEEASDKPAFHIENTTLFAVQILLGIPIFYLLTFAGREEESEVEIGVMCAALGLGAGVLTKDARGYQALSFILPVMFYVAYSTRVLPRLRVFKHAVRGLSYAKIGRYRQALQSLRRALQLDPQNKLARESLWSVHRALDLPALVNDPQTLALVDLDLCLERASALLLQPRPAPEKLHEALRLLDLISIQRPRMLPKISYWRAVACTHARELDNAVTELVHLLDPEAHDPEDPERQAILLPAWQLVLTLHPELKRRVGEPQLALPGRRMEAIAAVERHLATAPDDQDVWGIKRVLYQDLSEAEYHAAAQHGIKPGNFDHAYAHQLGLALINDAARWQRGAEYLRMAGHGLPQQGPSIFTHIAQAQQRNGDHEGAWFSYESAKKAAHAVGVRNLPANERQMYFQVVKLLGDAALKHDELDAAAENYQLYTEYERSGLETLRTLADIHERRGDPLAALRFTDQALVYSAKDKDLLERKDRYYYSVMPDMLRPRLESLKSGFDVAYCLRKARSLLDVRGGDLDLVDWAQHLTELAVLVTPESLATKVLLARIKLRRGEKEEAAAILDDVYRNKPEKFATTEDDEAWHLACKLLGDLYLFDLARPDLAVACYQDFRKSSKSGADTLYKMGQAYEQLGDFTKAKKFFEHVAAYDGHPLIPEAREALYRLQANQVGK